MMDGEILCSHRFPRAVEAVGMQRQRILMRPRGPEDHLCASLLTCVPKSWRSTQELSLLKWVLYWEKGGAIYPRKKRRSTKMLPLKIRLVFMPRCNSINKHSKSKHRTRFSITKLHMQMRIIITITIRRKPSMLLHHTLHLKLISNITKATSPPSTSSSRILMTLTHIMHKCRLCGGQPCRKISLYDAVYYILNYQLFSCAHLSLVALCVVRRGLKFE
mmetsp:Transcript_26301/g.37693  ORF Transcript_26301/g.37693 Transcript_26301/m.37693 type:complete len:218 (+) Transcript_26301:924-1577(+)